MKDIRLMVAGVAVITCLAGITACSDGTDDEPAAVCMGFVVGARSNSAPPSHSEIADSLPDPLPVGSVVVVTGVSGSANGDPVFAGQIEDAENSYDVEDDQLNTRAGAISSLNAMSASSPQADLLGAIEATADTLRPSGMSCTIYVHDSGLQTIGLIKFQQGLLGMGVDEIVEKVPQSETLVGTTVVFESLGMVAPPQPAPDSASRATLNAIWKGIIERRGGTTAASTQVAGARPEQKPGLPDVDVVEIPEVTIDIGDIPPGCTADSTTWTLPDSILFEADSTVLTKDAKSDYLDVAADALRDYFGSYPQVSVIVIGHTASVSPEATGMKFSEDRAQAVVDYLISRGVDGNRISAHGVGDTQPYACEDFDPVTGQQIPGCAEQERRVELSVLGLVLCQ